MQHLDISDIIYGTAEYELQFLGAFRNFAKSDYCLHQFCLSVCPHGTTRLPLDGFL